MICCKERQAKTTVDKATLSPLKPKRFLKAIGPTSSSELGNPAKNLLPHVSLDGPHRPCLGRPPRRGHYFMGMNLAVATCMKAFYPELSGE